MLTPIEIRQQSFNREFRGYNRVEVDAFLQEVAKVMEQQLEANRSLKENLEKIKASYDTLKEVENMLHKTLMQAEQSSRSTVENARKKAELKIQEAESKARDIIQRGITERNRIDSEIEELHKRREEVLTQLQVFLQSQMSKLEKFEHSRELYSSSNQHLGPAHTSHHENLFETYENGNGNRGHNLYDDIADEL